jgi:hypothetical protein
MPAGTTSGPAGSGRTCAKISEKFSVFKEMSRMPGPIMNPKSPTRFTINALFAALDALLRS